MTLKQVMEIMDALDSAKVNGNIVGQIFASHGCREWEVERIEGPAGSTDFVSVTIPGLEGKREGGNAPTLGIVGRLGSVGARPELLGLISDADGAIVALSGALKLIDSRERGDSLMGDVIVCTHISPRAPVPKDPIWGSVKMADSPVDRGELLKREVRPEMEAILSIDATKANRLVNHRGFAISPTVKEGYILRPSEDLLDIMQATTGRMPVVFPLSTQDVTPHQGLRHINSIMTPAAMTNSPVVGVAITAEVPVPGIATGANQPVDLDMAVRFCVEVAKAFGKGECNFFDPEEFKLLVRLYGTMSHLQTQGRKNA